ncbi:MAG TPA: hypothetical protein DHN33_06720, partial [Eubacteriaceae bacterium]|nr:hypothetical protein [Eubacteriaceae bacterium]
MMLMIFTAQDKQEAMKKAADHFGCEKERLKVRVVEQPKKKLLGLKNVEGRYEIEMEEEKPKRDPKNDGRVKVENGEIIVKDPVEDGLPSSVFIKKGNMELFVNGEPVKSTMNFREEDEITVTFNDEKPKIHSHIVFSDDKVRAELHIESTKGKRFYLEDSEAQNRIVLEPVEEEIFPKKVTYDEVVELLKQAGIPEKFHDSQAIQQAIESGESTQILVAKGMDPVESQETKIKYCDEIFVKEITRGMEPVVSKGSKLAEKTASAQPGTPGVTVQGEEIPVREVEDIPLEAGDGAVLKGNAVYAEIDGRPILDKGVVKVIPLLTVVG